MNLPNLLSIITGLVQTAQVVTTKADQGGAGIGGSQDAKHVQQVSMIWQLIAQIIAQHPAAQVPVAQPQAPAPQAQLGQLGQFPPQPQSPSPFQLAQAQGLLQQG